MTKIFISYRRQDTKLIVGRIFDRLKEKFGSDGVFMDIDKIPFGVDFREHLDREVGQADAVLVLIGNGWLDARDEQGRRCLDNPDDFVRIEIETALKRNIPVGAVLIDGAPLPKPDQLPESLQPLLSRNAAQLDVVRDFDAHMARLITDLKQHPDGWSKAATLSAEQAEMRLNDTLTEANRWFGIVKQKYAEKYGVSTAELWKAIVGGLMSGIIFAAVLAYLVV